MSVERKRRVFELLDQALERSGQDRPAFLDQVCGDDAALRLELESLLDTEVEGGLLAKPAFSVHTERQQVSSVFIALTPRSILPRTRRRLCAGGGGFLSG